MPSDFSIRAERIGLGLHNKQKSRHCHGIVISGRVVDKIVMQK
jgi:hypothetical protein